MATKTCPNGHQYDSSIYGDNCPFCPSEKTRVVPESGHTQVVGETDVLPTLPMTNPGFDQPEEEGGTVIRTLDANAPTDGGKRLVGLLVSYTHNPLGEVYHVYEGRTFIGRGKQNDISVSQDKNMSGTHLMILYREAEGYFWAIDQNSSNGTYINGKFCGDKMTINTNDVIVAGATKFVFLAIPNL